MLARGRGSFAPIMVASAGSPLDSRCRLVVDDVVDAHAPPSIAATVAATASSMCTKSRPAASSTAASRCLVHNRLYQGIPV
jgi:hypothetical protein